MKNKYVILTGSKNNAGDFLIKYRAKQLFTKIRPDRDIIDFNAWEKFNDQKLKMVNESKALILVGGPALRKGMRDKIYKMTDSLDDIKVPIIMMGIGWHSFKGDWKDTYNYSLNSNDIELLKRINESGYQSSVRDYHTLNVLYFKKFKNFIMTGCPAYYDLNCINKSIKIDEIKKIAFSIGVSFIRSKSMEKLLKQSILLLRDKFKNQNFEVVFHHSLDKNNYVSSYGKISLQYVKQKELTEWLKKENINYVDISGSAENLINYYNKVDLHVGYRVHAHIFMNSISKFSILLAEDGRGKAVKDVIGGIVINTYDSFKYSTLSKVLNRITMKYDIYNANPYVIKEMLYNIDYERKIEFNRIKNSRKIIDENFQLMKKFLEQLP